MGGKHPAAAPSHSLGYLRREEISSAPAFRSRPALAVWEKRKKKRRTENPKEEQSALQEHDIGTKRDLLVPRTRSSVHLAKEDSLRRTYRRRGGGRKGVKSYTGLPSLPLSLRRSQRHHPHPFPGTKEQASHHLKALSAKEEGKRETPFSSSSCAQGTEPSLLLIPTFLAPPPPPTS